MQRTSRMTNGLPALKVDRTTRWGNPFRPAGQGDLRKAWSAHRHWLTMDTPQAYLRRGAAVVHLRGYNLACWCPLPPEGQPDRCHAATLLAVANAAEPAHPIALLAALAALGGAVSGCGAKVCPIRPGPSGGACCCVARGVRAAEAAERWQLSWPHSDSNPPRRPRGVPCDCRWCIDHEGEGT